MLTLLTQKAIAVLHDIAGYETDAVRYYEISADELSALLSRLEEKELIYRLPDGPAEAMSSYKLCRHLSDYSLLDVIEALHEHLNCDRPVTEEFYFRYGRAAQKLGVVNHMTRLYLSEIKLTEC